MRLRQIEVFRAVMLVGTVSEAARMLAVSQPVVTRVLQHTELQLGFRLFDRTKGRLQPTAEAFELFTEVERLYQEVERVRRVSANLRHKGAGRLRVAATPSLAPSILAPAVRHFSQRHPDTQVRVFTHHTAEIVQGLLSQDIDVGFAFAPPVHPAIGTTPVAQGRILLAAPRAWVDAGADGPALHRMVAERPFIALEDQMSIGSLVGQDAGAQRSRAPVDAGGADVFAGPFAGGRGAGRDDAGSVHGRHRQHGPHRPVCAGARADLRGPRHARRASRAVVAGRQPGGVLRAGRPRALRRTARAAGAGVLRAVARR